jgi:hypothetical protein
VLEKESRKTELIHAHAPNQNEAAWRSHFNWRQLVGVLYAETVEFESLNSKQNEKINENAQSNRPFSIY